MNTLKLRASEKYVMECLKEYWDDCINYEECKKTLKEFISEEIKKDMDEFNCFFHTPYYQLDKEAGKARIKFLKKIANQCELILNSKGKIIFQFYPKSDTSMHEIGKIFNETGQFNGNFIIDNPDNPKKRKIFLYLEKK